MVSVAHTVWFATLVASSLALQNQLTNQQAQLAAQSPKEDAWATLLKAFKKDQIFKQNVCNTKQYHEYYEKLPPLKLSKLEIPANKKILFYGTSFLHQVLETIVIANDDILIKSPPLYGFEGENLAKDETTKWMTGWLSKWDFTVNSTIMEVQNFAQMQFPQNVGNLTNFLQEHEFDMAFFMNPHPQCHFGPDKSPISDTEYCQCFIDCHAKDDCDWFNDCNPKYEGSLRGKRKDVHPLWAAIHKAVKGKVYEVEAWTTEPRKVFHADEAHTIRTHPVLSGHACNQVDTCHSSTELMGHQCMPGRLSKVSELVMTAAQQAIK